MLIWRALTALAVASALPWASSAQPLKCALQRDAVWNDGPEAVSAIICNGVPGFFVPSPLYRRLRRPSESPEYKLLDRELQLSTKETEAVREGLARAESALKRWKDIADADHTRWLDAEGRYQKQLVQTAQAGQRAWHEARSLWIAVGVLLTLAGLVVYERTTQD